MARDCGIPGNPHVALSANGKCFKCGQSVSGQTYLKAEAAEATELKEDDETSEDTDAPVEDKPKRTRRSRAQIDSDESSDKDSEEVADSENSNQ